MSDRDIRGIESLPMVLVISIALGAFALAFGVKSLTQVRSLLEDQQAVESFDTFVERVYSISFGGTGSEQSFELDLPRSEIIVQGKLIQLKIENEIRRSKILPLPVFLDRPGSGFSIRSGNYTLKLQHIPDNSGVPSNGGYFLCLRRSVDGPARLPSRFSP